MHEKVQACVVQSLHDLFAQSIAEQFAAEALELDAKIHHQVQPGWLHGFNTAEVQDDVPGGDVLEFCHEMLQRLGKVGIQHPAQI